MLKKTVFNFKLSCIYRLALLILSCGQHIDQSKALIVQHAVYPAPERSIADTNATGQIISPYQKELNNALADPAIDNYYKEICRQEKLSSWNDDKLLSITDSLFTSDPDKDLFYFIVFTKSMNGADGYYSEALGFAAYRFITQKTECFADYFNIAPKLSDLDMDNWVIYICGEIEISREGEELKAVKELEELLLESIKGARKEYQFVISKLMEKVKSTILP